MRNILLVFKIKGIKKFDDTDSQNYLILHSFWRVAFTKRGAGFNRRGIFKSNTEFIRTTKFIAAQKISSNNKKIPYSFPIQGEMSAGYGFVER